MVLLPATPTAGVKPEDYREHGYATVVNLLGYSSVVIPATKVDKRIDLYESDYNPIGLIDEEVWKSCE